LGAAFPASHTDPLSSAFACVKRAALCSVSGALLQPQPPGWLVLRAWIGARTPPPRQSSSFFFDLHLARRWLVLFGRLPGALSLLLPFFFVPCSDFREQPPAGPPSPAAIFGDGVAAAFQAGPADPRAGGVTYRSSPVKSSRRCHRLPCSATTFRLPRHDKIPLSRCPQEHS